MPVRTLVKLAFAATLAVLACAATPAIADDPGDALKSEIEAYFKRLGALHWEGADTFTVHQDGNDTVAVIDNGRFSLRKEGAAAKGPVTMTLDHLEIRRKTPSDGSDTVSYAIALPATSTFATPAGIAFTLSLVDGTATVQVGASDNRYRSLDAKFASARVDGQDLVPASVKFGAAKLATGITANTGGGWTGPVNFDIDGVEFLFPDAQLAGKIKRISHEGEAGGPNLDELYALRDQIEQVRAKAEADPANAGNLWLPLLPRIFSAFDHTTGTLTVEGTTVTRPDGETLVTIAKTSVGGSATGLGNDKATLRWVYHHDGLAIAPSLVPEPKVPQRIDLDLALEDIAGAPLRQMIEAMSKAGPGATDADKNAVVPQLIGAAMALQPVLRLHNLSAEFKDVRIDVTGEARRAPPAPIGYTAFADIAVRDFDALSGIVGANGGLMYLPLLKFLGEPSTDISGAPVTKFHLASQTGKPLALDGSDISAWFGAGDAHPAPDQPRVLRLVLPPLIGDDVRAVQKKVNGRVDGIYDGATALAVARYQKSEGLNVNGVVDAATRDKLGLNPPPAPAKN